MLRRTNLSHICLILAVLTWVFSSLSYIHRYPLNTFYQEWWSALFGVLVITLFVAAECWNNQTFRVSLSGLPR